jgi:hypothetical protein
MMRIVGGLVMAVVAVSAAQAVNYVPNPGFESCVAAAPPGSWAAVGGESAVCDGTVPETGSYDLGLSNATNMGLARAQSACVVVPPGTFIDDLSFAYRTSSASVYQVALTIDFYTGSDCTGTNGSDSTGAGYQYGQTLSKDGNWHALTPRTANVDAATNSVRFTASFQVQATQITSTVDFDDLSFATNATTTTTGAPASSTTSTTDTGTATTSTTMPTFTGTGNPASECFVTATGLSATSDGRVACVDGDPVCDADEVANGVCVFRFEVCVAEVLAGCQVSTITAVTARPESLHVALPTVPVSAPACGPETQVVVPLVRHGRGVGRRTVTLTAENTGKPKHERDRIRFQCRPHR